MTAPYTDQPNTELLVDRIRPARSNGVEPAACDQWRSEAIPDVQREKTCWWIALPKSMLSVRRGHRGSVHLSLQGILPPIVPHPPQSYEGTSPPFGSEKRPLLGFPLDGSVASEIRPDGRPRERSVAGKSELTVAQRRIRRNVLSEHGIMSIARIAALPPDRAT
eukprot:scaffold346_cov347-Pavlova_lutheri.AAC.54